MTTEDIDVLINKLCKHALPDPHDEREVLHAPMLKEAAEALQSLREEIASLKEDSIRVCNRETELLKEVGQLTKERDRMREALEKIAKSYYGGKARLNEIAQQALQDTPEGSEDMVLVPREPTEEMIEAGWRGRIGSIYGERQGAIVIYKAMIAATQTDTPEGGCEHGRDMTEYCLECGRVNGGE